MGDAGHIIWVMQAPAWREQGVTMTTVTRPDASGEVPAGPAGYPGRRRARRVGSVRPGPAGHPGVPPAPTALTVKMSARSMESLVRAARQGELNLTDTVNRAVQLYDFVLGALAENKRNALVIVRDGRYDRINLG
jgi:hypothetical protein